jgi:hypothetical protein
MNKNERRFKIKRVNMKINMNKLFLTTFLLGVLVFSMSGVLADTQTVSGDVPQNIDFNLLTTSVDYGSIIPGSNSLVKENQLRVNINNNVDFSVDIKLGAGSNDLFKNLYFDINGNAIFEPSEKLDSTTLVLPITDQATEFTATLNSRLTVPEGQAPIVGATGTVTYTITGATPL